MFVEASSSTCKAAMQAQKMLPPSASQNGCSLSDLHQQETNINRIFETPGLKMAALQSVFSKLKSV
jgi:hypothetical protein